LVGFWYKSFPVRVEKGAVLCGAALSDWGRDFVRPLAFVVDVVLVFGFVYHFLGDGYKDALIKASNITLVAGYTAYYSTAQSQVLRLIETLNLVVGLFWYSLLIPMISRRIQR
jgi:hypothetical protein